MPHTITSHHLLKVLLEHFPDLIFFKDRESRYLEINEAMVRFTGVPKESMLGRDTRDFLPAELSEQVRADDQAVMAGGVPVRRESWIENGEGRMMLMDTILVPMVDDSGELQGLMGIGRDITEMRRTSDALREQYLALEKTNKELDTLIYHAAHDLRAPLTSLLGLLNLIRQERDPNQMAAYLNMQEDKIRQLDSFIQAIVDLSKNNREGIAVGKVQLRTMYDGIIEQFRFLPGAQRVAFSYESLGETPLVTDGFRLSLVLSNLISNAIRYQDIGKNEASVRLTASIQSDQATIELSDNGIGIPPEHIGQVFEMFHRAHRTSKGSGIGLYITRETVMKLGGSIVVESTEGVGSTFRITLPNHFKA